MRRVRPALVGLVLLALTACGDQELPAGAVEIGTVDDVTVHAVFEEPWLQVVMVDDDGRLCDSRVGLDLEIAPVMPVCNDRGSRLAFALAYAKGTEAPAICGVLTGDPADVETLTTPADWTVDLLVAVGAEDDDFLETCT